MLSAFIVGIDEAGRGPIAGPVSVGFVIWKNNLRTRKLKELKGIKDSKKLSEKEREKWFRKIKDLKRRDELDFSCKMVSSRIIDQRGIISAIRVAVSSCCKRSIPGGSSSNTKILLDGGLRAPEKYKNQKTIIKGDEKIQIISAASVVAKVMRDRKMRTLSKKYPEYGFEKHKGYGTREHYERIKKFGLSKEHRRSFIKF